MENKNYLLGVRIDSLNYEKLKSALEKFTSSKKFNMITPVNPEMLITARDNNEFKQVLNNSELTTCDGSGIVFVFKLKSNPIKRYQGSSMIFDVLDFCEKNNKKIFFLGTKQNVNERARKNAKLNYPKIKISGYSPPPYVNYPNEQFPNEEEDKIFNELKKFKPDILCAFWGAPFQEIWFSKNRKKLENLGIKIGISLGGTADFLSGYTKRAPKFFQKTNLEWLYRLITEKNRFKRFFTRIPKFVFLSVKEILD